MISHQPTIKDLGWILFRDFYEKKCKEEIAPEDFAAKGCCCMDIFSAGKRSFRLTKFFKRLSA